MNIKELREAISNNFLKEPSHTRRLSKTYEVLDGIDHKRPFAYVVKDFDHVEALQLPKTITSPALDIQGATTAPNGYVWIWNRKSIFSDEYRHALLKKKEL